MSVVLKFCRCVYGYSAQCLYCFIFLQLVQKFVLEDLEDERDDGAEWYEKDCLPYKMKYKVSYGKYRTETCLKEIRHCGM